MSEDTASRIVAVASGKNGKYSGYHQTTSRSMDDTILVKYDDRKIIPVLFLPGVMGTNLKNEELNDQTVWEPPNNIFSGIATLFEYMGKKAAERGIELDPKSTEVYQKGSVSNFPLLEDVRIQRDRYWGEIYSSCYHKFMATLQSRLNRVYSEDTFNGKRPLVNNWDKLLTFDPMLLGKIAGKGEGKTPCLTIEELDHLKHFRFEVWAGGYNWLQDLTIAAEKILARIDAILKSYTPSQLATDKVLIIAHSMGGLVARRLALIDAKNILGVILGAVPVNGAAETYSNMRQGLRGALGYVVGKNSEQVTAVLAYAEGPLQLLPFAKRYCVEKTLGNPWLHIREHGNRKYLPVADDPYTDIYMTDKWYGLIPEFNEKKLPAKKDEATTNEDSPDKGFRKIFKDTILGVKKFQDEVGGKYFQDTFAFWGCDDEHTGVAALSWDPVSANKAPAAGTGIQDTGTGMVFDGTQWCTLKIHTHPGDGTVPYASWQKDVGLPRMVFLYGRSALALPKGPSGFEHQQAFNDERALWVSLYATTKLVAEKVPPPK